MRVTNRSIYEAVKYNLGKISEELSKSNRIVSTGKRITNLSDDPVGLTQVLNIKSSLSNMDQLGRNITLGKTWLSASESALGHVQDLISEAKSLAIQMSNATIGQAERVSGAATIQQMLEEIVSLANTETSGRYIFAGSKTDTTPFDQGGTYNGDNNAFTIKIGKDATIQAGSDGEAVFEDVFTTFSDMKTALESNDIGGIQAAMSNLDNDFEHITAKISEIGSRMIRMEIKENIFQDLKITNTDRLSKIEDADIIEAIIDLKTTELAYQVAMASSAKVMELNLFDYL